MSNIIDDFGDPDRSRTSRALNRIAHLLPRAATVVFGALIANDLAGGEVMPTWLAMPLVFAYIVILYTALFHNSLARICLRCMQDGPADAPVRAQRRRFLLWIFHHSLRTALAWAVLFGAGVAARAVLHQPGLVQLDVPALLVAFASVWSGWTHHRLRPWCPFCRRWDDGQGPRERVPDPDPAGVKQPRG